MVNKNELKQNKLFFTFLLKVHERLTIMLDDNVGKNVDPKEHDINLLKRLYELYDSMSDDDIEITVGDIESVQQDLFSDKPS